MIKSQKDFFAGLMFIIVGIGFALGSTSYQIGTGARMGAGYFPLMLGILLTVLGSLVTFGSIIKGLPGGDKIGKWAWKPLFFILLANFVFGVCLGGLPSIGLPPFGLIIGIIALTFISSLAGDEFNFMGVSVLAAILTIGSYSIFIKALKLQMPIWPTFLVN